MDTAELTALVAPIRHIAQQATERILAIYRGHFSVTEKSDHTPLTEADLVAHQCILAGLQALTPGCPILSEEDDSITLAERRRWQRLWLVDPLDGTREFIRRSGQFSINIALIDQHQPVFGLIHSPIDGSSYFAYRGGGAYKQVGTEAPCRIHTRRLDQRPVRITSGRRVAGRALQRYLQLLGQHHYLTLGSSLKSCLVAEGKADLYPRFGPTSEWDTAAAQIIVEEAGGGLTDTAMHPLRYNARPTLVNPDFFVFGDRSRDWSQYLPRRPSWPQAH